MPPGRAGPRPDSCGTSATPAQPAVLRCHLAATVRATVPQPRAPSLRSSGTGQQPGAVMQHKNLTTRASAVKRLALTTAVAAAMFGTIAATTAFSSHPATPAAARPAAARLVTATPAVSPAAKPESALARAFKKYFRHQAASGMTAWIKTGTESSNEAILMQARGDAYPHRNAALPADSAALAAAARNGLAHPSPLATARWNKIMHDEITIAREPPVIPEGNAATAEATIIKYDYLAFARATS